MLRAFPAPGREFDTGVITAAVIRMFCDYPESTVLAVSDPVKGLPAALRYFPTIAEVKAALEALEAPKRARQAAENRIRDTQRLIAAPQQTATQEERDRAVARWEAERDGHKGRTPEELRAEADADLRRIWNTRDQPVVVGEALKRVFAAMKGEPRD